MTGIVIPDGGTIGSTSDTDALTISSSGAVTFSQDINPNNFVGMIAPFAMATPPTGWLACDGSAVSRTTYADLFTAIGTTWGAGDGSSTFALPDLEGAFLRGVGAHNTSNKADGTDFGDVNRAVGSFENDQMQSHGHWVGRTNNLNNASAMANTAIYISGSTGSSYGISETTRASTYRMLARDIVGTDYGTARDGDETRPFNAGVKYCIKY